MKKKLWLMGICIGILIILFGKSVYNQLKQDKEVVKLGQETTAREGNLMTEAEALRLLGFLGVNKEQLKETLGITEDTEAANDTYLAFGKLNSVFELICTELDIDKASAAANLFFDMQQEPEDNPVLVEEFLNLYENILLTF